MHELPTQRAVRFHGWRLRSQVSLLYSRLQALTSTSVPVGGCLRRFVWIFSPSFSVRYSTADYYAHFQTFSYNDDEIS